MPIKNGAAKAITKKKFSRLRQYYVAGILLLAPLGLTLWVLRLLIRFADSLFVVQDGYFLFFIPAEYHPTALLGFHVPGLGILLTLIILPVIGLLARNFIGKRLIRFFEQLLRRVPFISGLYKGIKQVFGTVLEQDMQNLGEVVLVEFPRAGAWSLAFITGEPYSKIQKKFKQKMLSVLVLTTPNPTTGYYMIVADDEVIRTGMSKEEAFKILLSFGILNPDMQDASGAFQHRRD